MNIKSCLLVFLALIIGGNAYSQRQDYIWYFGDGSDGIKFDSSGSISKLTNKYQSGTFGFEAMVTANDPLTGNLLFYSDGITVINKNHSVMTNGTNLKGNYDNSQGVVCCRKPNSCDKYYVIYNSASDNDTGLLYYSIVDFSSSSNGKVTNKNTSFGGINYHQGMTIVPRRNKNEYWLIVHKYQTAKYDVFLIDTSGVSSPTTYTFSNTGRSWTLRYSKILGKLGCFGQDKIKVSLFDFNDSTGVMSNEKQIGSSFSYGAYGGNFSPDGSKVYAIVMNGSNYTELQQYDFANSSWINTGYCCYAHDMKMAPDGNMYHIHTYNKTNPLAVINKPNLSASSNNFKYSTITSPGSFNGEVRRFPEFVILGSFPKTVRDTFSMNFSDSLIIPSSDLLLNDSDPQGDSISFSGIYSLPKYGSVSVVGKNVIYKPNSCGKTDTIGYKITDQWCTFDTGYIIIHINGIQKIKILSTDSVCSGKNVTLKTDYTGVKGTYFWSGPNGFISNKDSIALNNFSSQNEGAYSVYIVLNSCTTNVANFNIYLKKKCVKALFSYNNKCNGLVDFTNNSSDYTKLKWNFGDSTEDSIKSNFSHTYSINGKYIVMLVAYDSTFDSDTFTLTISTASDTSNSSSFAAIDTSGCDSVSCFCTNSSIGATNYIWDFGDGSQLDTNKNTSHLYTNKGNFIVKLISIDSIGCNLLDTSYKRINVFATNKADFKVSLKSGCAPVNISFANISIGGVKYIWDFGDGSTDSNYNTSHTYITSGTYLVKLISFDSYGCKMYDTANATIDIQKRPTASFLFKQKSCSDTIEITNNSNNVTSYQWDFGDGQTDTANNPIHVYSNSGLYKVKFIANKGTSCIDSVEKMVSIQPDTTIAKFSLSPRQGCVGQLANMNNQSTINKKYIWDFGDGIFDTNYNTNHVYNKEGEFIVKLTVIDSLSCSITKQIQDTISILSIIKADFYYENTPCEMTYRFINKNNNTHTYSWVFDSLTVDTSQSNPISHVFAAAGIYKVGLIENSGSNCADTLYKIITTSNIDSILIPNSFSPNGDGINDCYQIGGIAAPCDEIHIWIYNRWGELLWESKNINDCWQGYNAVGLNYSAGTYYYILDTNKTGSKTEKHYKGTITIVR